MGDKRARFHVTHATFAKYTRPLDADFRTFCYDERTIVYLRSTELEAIDEEHARTIVWESGDHWFSVDLYEHYLPRTLDALTPPDRCDDLYPEHLFEALDHQGFARWPELERRSVLAWIRAVGEELDRGSAREVEEWRAAAARLRTGSIERLPSFRERE